jgi:hypothetical protein
VGRKAKIYNKEKVKSLYEKYGSINDIRIRTGYGFEKVKEILGELDLIASKCEEGNSTEDKVKWSKSEIEQMNVNTLCSVGEGMAKGYFSKSILRRNGLEINVENYIFAYSVIADAFIKLYKSDIAYRRHKQMSLQY